MTFLDDTPAEDRRHDMEADMDIEQRAETWEESEAAIRQEMETTDYELGLECLIAHEVNRTFDAALGEGRR